MRQTSAVCQTAVEAIRRAALIKKVGTKKHILLDNVPKTATPADVLRLVRRLNIENVVGASLDYRFLQPRGQAYVEISKPTFMADALNALKGVTFGGHALRAGPYDMSNNQRSRGQDGRAEASNRGAVRGDGPQAGLQVAGQDVAVIGIPCAISQEEFKAYLVRNRLVEEGLDGKGLCEVLGTESPQGHFNKSRTRLLVRMKSTAAAHELAKRLNMTYFDPSVWRHKMPLRARVMY